MRLFVDLFNSIVLCCFSLVASLHAQSQPALIEAAKKEGKLVWYTSLAIDSSKPLLDAFLNE